MSSITRGIRRGLATAVAVVAVAGIGAVEPVISSAAAPPSSGQCLSPSYPTIGYGSRGSAVRALQCALNHWGFHLSQDGIFGGLTYNAVVAFQRQHGLAVDGVVGPQTWSWLYCGNGGGCGGR